MHIKALAAARVWDDDLIKRKAAMSKPATKTLGEDLAGELADDLGKSLHKVRHELERAGETLHDDARTAINEASLTLNRAAHALTAQAKGRSEAAIATAKQTIDDHPIATAAAIAAAAATLAGVVIAARWPKAG